MKGRNVKKLIILNLPYIILGLVAALGITSLCITENAWAAQKQNETHQIAIAADRCGNERCRAPAGPGHAVSAQAREHPSAPDRRGERRFCGTGLARTGVFIKKLSRTGLSFIIRSDLHPKLKGENYLWTISASFRTFSTS